MFNLFKKKHQDPSKFNELSKSIEDSIDTMANAPMPEPVTDEEYTAMRLREEQWLESHYQLNSIEGVKCIPAEKGLRCPETTGVTGQLYYYLRRKAYEHEKAGKMDLAVACMAKSSELAMLDYGNRILKQELYPLVRILARNGQVEEAIAEKAFVDEYCQKQNELLEKELLHDVILSAKQLETDLVIMSAHGAVCSECAKYQGRVYSLSGHSKKYPKLPAFIYGTGRVHPGCMHFLSAFIDGVSDPMLEYTLSVHPLSNKSYGKNIVVFSNRPFVDDRTDDVKAAADAHRAERAKQIAQDKQNDENMIAYETKRGNDMRDFFWIQENIPDKRPKSVTGYRRMKTQNTKNYQILKQLAAAQGRKI